MNLLQPILTAWDAAVATAFPPGAQLLPYGLADVQPGSKPAKGLPTAGERAAFPNDRYEAGWLHRIDQLHWQEAPEGGYGSRALQHRSYEARAIFWAKQTDALPHPTALYDALLPALPTTLRDTADPLFWHASFHYQQVRFNKMQVYADEFPGERYAIPPRVHLIALHYLMRVQSPQDCLAPPWHAAPSLSPQP